jgi:hypothetical protein
MKKLFCDFCDGEINLDDHEGQPLFQETLALNGKRMGIQISVFDPNKQVQRSEYDICRTCVFRFVDMMDPRPKAEV